MSVRINEIPSTSRIAEGLLAPFGPVFWERSLALMPCNRHG